MTVLKKLVTIIELMKRGRTDEGGKNRLRTVKREVASALSRSSSARRGCRYGGAGVLFRSTSGKVRRSASVGVPSRNSAA